MNKPLSRRGFLGAAVAAPVVAKSGALRALAARIEESVVLAQAGVAVGAEMPLAWGISIMENKALYAALKMGMLPDWARGEIEENVRQNSGGRLTPDVAGLRSVSLSAKFRIQQDRTRRKVWAEIDGYHINALARRAFWQTQNDGGAKPPL